jgi:hypothetical protein
MRLQRGKLEREKLKHAAEHAFDYTAPPPPKNMQAISKLALPASSKKKFVTPSDLSNIPCSSTNSSVKARCESDLKKSQTRVSGASFVGHISKQHFASPAVVAALSKIQSLHQNEVPSWQSGSTASADSNQLPVDSPRTLTEKGETSTAASRDLSGDAVLKSGDSTRKPSDIFNASDIALHGSVLAQHAHALDHHEIDVQSASRLSSQSPFREIENGIQLNETMKIESSVADNTQNPVTKNSLQQLIILFQLNENRYGLEDNEADGADHLITLPNAEIGGSSSHDECTSSSNRDGASLLPDGPKPRPLRLKMPILGDASSFEVRL